MEDTSQEPGTTRPPHPQTPPRSGTPRHEIISSWGTMIAGVATAAAPIFTGLSVRYEAQQTKDQNATNYMQVQDQNKQQADLINLWPAAEFSPRAILITVSNRSEEPIYEFRLYVALVAQVGRRSHGYLALSEWSSFPPCAQITFNLRAIAMSYTETAKLMGSSSKLPAFDYGIMFTDATGQAWHRHASGTLHRTPWLEYLQQKGYTTPMLPPVFNSDTLLSRDSYTIPEAHQAFVVGKPVSAMGCDASA